MRNSIQKKDRIARLLKIEILLWQNPRGLKLKEITNRCSVSRSTIYRDLKALECDIGVPVWEEGHKWGIAEGYFLPPINFTQTEAICVFQAIRLMQKLTNKYDPSIYSTFMKLNSVIPSPINQQIQNTIEFMDKQPRDERIIKNFNILMQAWTSRHKVRLCYQEESDKAPKERIVEPYFIEPLPQAHSNFLIGYCHFKKSIHAYNINYILGNVVREVDTYEIPNDFNINEYMSQAWDMHNWEKLETAKLHFSKRISSFITNTIWHQSQRFKFHEDGSVIMTITVRNTRHFRNWILSWGDNVEVLEPKTLRNQIIKFVEELRNIYLFQSK